MITRRTRSRRGQRRHAGAAAMLAALLAVLAGCAQPPTGVPSGARGFGTASAAGSASGTSPTPTAASASPTTPRAGTSAAAVTPGRQPVSSAPADGHPGGVTAVALLSTLELKGRAPKTGYTRAAFGVAWTDDNGDPLGHNGCDTRNDILRRDLHDVVARPGTRDCVIASGVLIDPYTGATIQFVRGESTSNAVQIDHVVALSNAWQTGAQYWPAAVRVDLANDPLNLLAVDGPANEAKGDGDAATWLPPNTAYRCAYVARQVAVKARYGLWITPAEHDAIARVLTACPGQLAPAEAGRPEPATTAGSPGAPAATSRASAAPAAARTTAHAAPAPIAKAYANCTALHVDYPHGVGRPGAVDHVRGSGKPVTDFYVSAALYDANRKSDGDGDGIACEKH